MEGSICRSVPCSLEVADTGGWIWFLDLLIRGFCKCYGSSPALLCPLEAFGPLTPQEGSMPILSVVWLRQALPGLSEMLITILNKLRHARHQASTKFRMTQHP